MDLQQCNKELDKAKIKLMSTKDSTFFTTIVLSLKFKWDDKQSTAYTDGKVLGFNPTFFMGMTPDERVGVLVHEAMHVAYMHMDRLNERDRTLFNMAADHVINLQLLDRGFKLPAFRLADVKYKGMGTEEVYNLLKQDQQQGKTMPELGMDDLVPSDIPSEELQNHVQDILVRAAIQSKMADDKPGSIPGDIEIFLDRLLNPKLPWNRILQKYLQAFAKNDYSFRKPNRRFFPQHYLPSLHGQNLMDLAVFVDISGSVTDEEFHTAVSETAGIFKMMKPSKISFGQFDTGIKSVDEIRNLMDMSKIQFTGRGGTWITPVIEWAIEKKPQLLLIFTDGEFNFPQGLEPNCPVVWLIHNNPHFTAPFGKVITYKV